MAEKIRMKIEEGLSDLHYLEKKEVLSEQEISEILKGREAFEYKMIKFTSKSVDFMEAIEFESYWVIII